MTAYSEYKHAYVSNYKKIDEFCRALDENLRSHTGNGWVLVSENIVSNIDTNSWTRPIYYSAVLLYGK